MLALAATLIAATADLSAHRRDEYLQAARIAIAADHVGVELALTPGIAVADRIIERIDTNGDEELSPAEQRTYSLTVLGGVQLGLDGRAVPLTLTRFVFPELAAIRNGDGVVVVEADARTVGLHGGQHRLVFKNENRSDGAVYLANPLIPDTKNVTITGQNRVGDQSELTIDFALRTPPAYAATVLLALGILTLVAVPLARRRRAVNRGSGAV